LSRKIELNTLTRLKSEEIFRKFIQKQNYEPFLLKVLNASKLFPNDLELIKSQDKGESDFYSNNENICYEATLLMDSNIAYNISNNIEYLKTDEFFDWIKGSILQTFKTRLIKKQSKSNIILFNIFPMRFPVLRGGVTMQFFRDDWDNLIDEIYNSNPELVELKDIFIVSMNYDNSFFVKQLRENYYIKRFVNLDEETKIIFPFENIEYNTSIISPSLNT